MPNWDDLYLVNAGFGIFTSTTGVAPHRTFNIEWRAQYFPGSGSANFEIQLREDSPIITVIYGTITNASSSTAGVQASATDFTQFSCNGTGGAITPGLRVDYVPVQHTLSVAKAGAGGGSVSSSPAGIDCGGACSAPFYQGTAVTLTAAPAAGSSFAGWSGGGCSGTGTCTTTMDADKTVTAAFNAQHTLSVAKTGAGSGSVSSSPAGIDCGGSCSAPFDEGTAVTLTATPDAGSSFTGWSGGGGCSGTGTCVVTMNGDHPLGAGFDVVPPPPPTAPTTKIDKAKINQDKNSATFKFEALTAKAAATSGFECALVKKKHATPKFKGCKSPKKYSHLKPHRYLFEVRAFDPAGKDATPAKKRFKIK
jgi:hypothetical protein